MLISISVACDEDAVDEVWTSDVCHLDWLPSFSVGGASHSSSVSGNKTQQYRLTVGSQLAHSSFVIQPSIGWVMHAKCVGH